ncbi:MAG: ABC transporter ATP-binding protein [Melioribacter sp.]|uniref:ABC transporter ATP-binding protein n=1 Tax=Rosettibacter primus TaxID=3111523 RepID=UPI00247B6FAA|nr:ABC transporter ATP-binding protein [Melioribacter sp.]
MNNYIIEAKDIKKSFYKTKEKKLEILKGISLNVEAGKITLIVGASGAGKSTFLHILGGLDLPDSGEVIIKNTNIFKLDDDKLSSFRNKNIGFVFQFHHLLPEFDALENVAIPIMINGISLKQAVKKAEELLDIVGLKERIHHKPSELSGGEQQRVAIARALANEPSIILADEPTGNLDSQNSEVVNNLFIELNKKFGITFLIVTHNPSLINLGDYVYEMKDGLIFNAE